MITAIGNTIQCSGIPMMCCQISTDRPSADASETTTVPTITAAATTLRVINNMMMKIKAIEAIPAMIKSQFAPSCMSLKVAAVPPR